MLGTDGTPNLVCHAVTSVPDRLLASCSAATVGFCISCATAVIIVRIESLSCAGLMPSYIGMPGWLALFAGLVGSHAVTGAKLMGYFLLGWGAAAQPASSGLAAFCQ